MRKSVDIDALVGEDTLELTLKGKTYEVKDIPLPLFMKIQSLDSDTDEDNVLILYKQLAGLIGIDVKEIEDVGYRAVSLALKEVQGWILDTIREGTNELIKEGEDLASEPKNP